MKLRSRFERSVLNNIVINVYLVQTEKVHHYNSTKSAIWDSPKPTDEVIFFFSQSTQAQILFKICVEILTVNFIHLRKKIKKRKTNLWIMVMHG